ncbi:MAG TPA: FeoB-associated Cys-rich membrane protein [Pirellulales bacterium]|nr:FeoB-associated Cys-rich membrane protein [Pirellulales bacterium]
MNFDSQDLAALAIVALACGYLLRQGWRLARREQPPGGCGGGCAKCPSGGAEKPTVVAAHESGRIIFTPKARTLRSNGRAKENGGEAKKNDLREPHDV